MRYGNTCLFFASAALWCLIPHSAYAQKGPPKPKVVEDLRLEIVAKQKALASQHADWEASLIVVSKRLEKGQSPTDRRVAKHLRLVLDNSKSAKLHNKKLADKLTAANFNNLRDSELVLFMADVARANLEVLHDSLSDVFGPRLQQEAYEELSKEIKAVVKQQSEIESLNLLDAMLAKEQARIRERTEMISTRLHAAGQGKGKIGEHLQIAGSATQDAIKVQLETEKLARDGNTMAALRKHGAAISALKRVNSEIEAIVYLGRILEHQAALKDVEESLDQALAAMRRIEKKARDVVKTIEKNENKRPTRAEIRVSQELSDSALDARKVLTKAIDKLDARGNDAIRTGVSVVYADLRTISRRFDIVDLNPETFEQLKKSTGILEKGIRAVQETSSFLAALEPGEFKAPAYQDIREAAKALENILAGQRELVSQLRIYRDSQIRGGPLPMLDGLEGKQNKKNK